MASRDRQVRAASLMAAASFLMVTSVASAAVVAPISFSSSTDFTSNFQTTFTTSGSTLSQAAVAGSDSLPGVLRFTAAAASSTGVTMYDTGAPSLMRFGSEAARVDFSTSQSGASIGLLLRVSDADTAGYMAVVNVHSTSDQIRFFKASGVGTSQSFNTGSAGTQLLNQQTTNSLNLSSFYTLQFTATNINSNTAVQLDAAVYAIGGTTPLAGMSLSYVDSSTPFLADGQAGLRLGSLSTSNTTLVDNFQIIPEPVSLSLVGAAVSLVALRRRRL